MTWRGLLKSGKNLLETSGVPGAEHDAREILFAVSGMDLTAYAVKADEQVPEKDEELFREYIGRRGRREPLQYILGSAPFFGREFIVRRGVLIPRFDTECLVEAVLPYIRSGMSILDVCTGSGCILLTLLLEGPGGLRGCGTDLSPDALLCARENEARYFKEIKEKKSSIRLLESDLFESVEESYDIIVSNPPYIPTGEIPGLDAEVRICEPSMALDGGEDGLDFYRAIIPEAWDHLTDGGLLALEIGSDETKAVTELLLRFHFSDIKTIRDLGGLDRALLGVKKQTEQILQIEEK